MCFTKNVFMSTHRSLNPQKKNDNLDCCYVISGCGCMHFWKTFFGLLTSCRFLSGLAVERNMGRIFQNYSFLRPVSHLTASLA